ncbi:MAG TPA: hypothetical protein VFV19_03045 [Candidatus Polarisedimenticolaceae bacterium]|nr:hypothetical protein [Candidatus Polarisedimenticolaceae bacterium]
MRTMTRLAGVALCIAGLLAAAAFPRSVPLSLACLLAVGAGLVILSRLRSS